MEIEYWVEFCAKPQTGVIEIYISVINKPSKCVFEKKKKIFVILLRILNIQKWNLVGTIPNLESDW